MDYEYMETVVSGVYQTLPAPAPFPGAVEPARHLGEGYTRFSLLGVHPVLVMGKKTRKRNSASICFDTQAAGWDLRENTDLGQALEFAFMDEDELDCYARGGPRRGTDVHDVPPLSLGPEVRRAVLYGAFNRWARGTGPVYISVPAEADWDCYIFGAVKAIDACLPGRLRAEVGFSTGIPERLDRITFLFQPEGQGGLDLRKGGAAVRTTGMASMDALLDHLAYAEEGERNALLRQMELKVEQGRFLQVEPYDYAEFWESLQTTETRTEQALVDDSEKVDSAPAPVEYLVPLWKRDPFFIPFVIAACISLILAGMLYFRPVAATVTEEAVCETIAESRSALETGEICIE